MAASPELPSLTVRTGTSAWASASAATVRDTESSSMIRTDFRRRDRTFTGWEPGLVSSSPS
jgi:hypothetical protein